MLNIIATLSMCGNMIDSQIHPITSFKSGLPYSGLKSSYSFWRATIYLAWYSCTSSFVGLSILGTGMGLPTTTVTGFLGWFQLSTEIRSNL